MTRGALLALASLVPFLSGCIAAAIPLAAGATVLRTRAAHTGEGRVAALAPLPGGEAKTGIVVTDLTALPPPDSAQTISSEGTAAFAAYALDRAGIPGTAAKRQSALLTSASELRATRMECGARPPAVLIDLDPGRGAFDPLAPGAPDAALAAALPSLRERGIAVIWSSRLGENFAGAVRAALAGGGLDPAGVDTLVLMRDIGERKQSRRDDMAKRWCPIAILGDERADFDELYLYLRDQQSAVALDAMLGRGWFIASPFDATVVAKDGAP